MNHRDPQGLALAPTTTPLVELMDWLASPDGGALRLDQSIDLARAIARGEVPHVGMMCVPTAPFELLRADLVAPCGTGFRIEATHFDMCHVTTALVGAGWIVKLLQRAE